LMPWRKTDSFMFENVGRPKPIFKGRIENNSAYGRYPRAHTANRRRAPPISPRLSPPTGGRREVTARIAASLRLQSPH
jgi:hypothetical protein